MTRDDRVLAVMTKAPRAGHVKTRLAPAFAPDQITGLYRAFIEDTFETGRALGVRTVAVCPSADAEAVRAWLPAGVEVVAQSGTGLAAALTSVFERLCTPARNAVIALSGDAPHVSAATLGEAFAHLRIRDVVIGPCDDGGYYLVGATCAHDGLFAADVMGTQSAADALRARADALGLTVALAPEHYDVDRPQDVDRLARDLSANRSRAPRTRALLAAWAHRPCGSITASSSSRVR